MFAAEPCIIDLGCGRGGRSPPPSRLVSCSSARMVAAGGFSNRTKSPQWGRERAFSVASVRLFHFTARSDLSVVSEVHFYFTLQSTAALTFESL